MYCRNCGKEVDEQALVCPACGFRPSSERKYCRNCGAQTQPNQVLCVQCGHSLLPAGSKKRITAGILAIVLGVFGIHKFYLEHTREGLILLLITVCTIFILAFIPAVIGIAEGIIYLSLSDAEFEETYVQQRKKWF